MNKNVLITFALFLFGINVLAVSAGKPVKKKVVQKQYIELKQTNEQSLIFLKNLSKKNTGQKKDNLLFLTKRKPLLKKRLFEILKKIETKKKITKKKAPVLQLEINKFEDKNGDGINDFVANPRL